MGHRWWRPSPCRRVPRPLTKSGDSALYSGRELQALLGTIGFTVRGLFADYSGAGFNDAKGGKVVILAEAAA